MSHDELVSSWIVGFIFMFISAVFTLGIKLLFFKNNTKRGFTNMIELSVEEKNLLLASIRDIHDFPKPGIVFKDITTLLNNAKAFKLLMDHLEARCKGMNLDYIAGIEIIGYIFGAHLADRLGIGFVPIRQPGKLPSTVVSEKYTLEYGTDEVQVHIDAFDSKEGARVLLIDDLMATGGTAGAAASLITKTGAKCVESVFIIELGFLSGRQKVEAISPVYSVLQI